MIPVMLSAGASIVGGSFPETGDTEGRVAPSFDTDKLIDLAKAKAFNSDRFTSNPPFFWRSEISSDRVDSYFTRMHESTLRAFADAATEGVSFQYSHDWKKLGLGKSLLGSFERISGKTSRKKASPDANQMAKDIEATMRTVVDFYTVPGLKMNDQMATDDFILGVETGLLFDVSVGFYAGSVKCGICGGEMYNGWFGIWGKDCNHFPGETYAVMDKNGNETGERQLCYAWIYDGSLSEVSQVYDGATPSAGHLKAELWANNNLADGQRIRSLETLYRTKLPGGAYQVSVAERKTGDDEMKVTGKTRATRDDDPTPKVDDIENPEDLSDTIDGTTVDDPAVPNPDPDTNTDDTDGTTDETEDERAMLDDLQARFGPQGITLAGSARETIEFLATTVVERGKRIKALEPDAKAGAAYRNTLIATGHRDGTAALGDTYDKEMYEGIFRDLSIEKLEKMVADFTKRADARFPNGRQTTEEEAPANVVEFERKSGDDIPDSAFR